MPDGNKRLRKALFFILVPILVIIAGAVTYATYLTNTAKDVVEGSYNNLEGRDEVQKSELREDVVDPRVDNISILFLGIDDDGSGTIENTRTDAMILATFNEEKKSVKMVSIPRDSRVELVGRDRMDKITHAHAYGGVDMAVKSVEELFDIPVDYYARLNFEAFISIVDILDGIEINVPFDIVEQDSDRNLNAIHIEKGLQTLNGEEALAYARTRKYDNDIERGKRQQEVLQAIIEKGTSFQSITKYKTLLTNIGDNLTTNMTFADMTAFHDYAYQLKDLEIEMLALDGKDAKVNHSFLYILDTDSVAQISNEFKEHLELQ